MKKMSEIFINFNIFSDFPQDLIQDIKGFYVSNYPHKFSYCVLNNKNVYYLSESTDVIVSDTKTLEYVLVKELCEENIQEFYRGKCMFARNDENQIFSWGNNNFGQLAMGYKSDEYLLPKKVNYFDGKFIINISCGDFHCLALSSDGLVYGWGDNCCDQFGFANGEKILSTPIEIHFEEQIQFIHCSWNMSFAITFTGKAYYWGEFGSISYYPPKLIPINNVLKICYQSPHGFIILHNMGKVFQFNPLNQAIDKINIDEIIDIYQVEDICLLQSKNNVHRLEDKILIETDFSNILDYCLQNLIEYKKTIHISEERNLLIKRIQLNKNDKILMLMDQNILQYEIIFKEIKELGRGSSGVVYEVKQRSNNQHYAIKKVENIDNLKEVLKEIEIISNLNSNYVVKYYGSWVEDVLISHRIYKIITPFLFIKMELSEHNLRQLIELMKTSDNISQTSNYLISHGIFKELIECVNYLHSLDPPIIHRDLKPENILIFKGFNERFLKLCDFGEAKFHLMSIHTRMVGTQEYMAPEVKFSNNYNTKSDIYSVALIGTEIFLFDDNIKIIRSHTTLSDFNKYQTKYLNTILENEFKKLLEIFSNCLLAENYYLRPDSKVLLEIINELSVDKNSTFNNQNGSTFQSCLENIYLRVDM